MDRAFSLPKLSLKPCLVIVIIFYLIFLIPNSTLANVTGSLELTDASWQEKTAYRPGETLYIQVTDADENKSSTVKDTLSVSVVSATETTAETVTLTETDVSTGILRGSIALDDKGSTGADGKLQITTGDKITVAYKDLTDDWGNSITTTKTAYFGTQVSGNISTDTTWTKDMSPYFVTGDVVVYKSTLTIEPGVEVRFMAGVDDAKSGRDSSLSELIIEGKLKAIGNPANRIIFTSSAMSPAPGDWGGIGTGLDGRIELRYCDIKYAQIGIYAYGHYTPVSADNCTISYSHSHGMVLFQFEEHPEYMIINNVIAHNNGSGIILDGEGWGPYYIRNNLITDNKGSGIEVYYNWEADCWLEYNTIVGNKNGIAFAEAGGYTRYDVSIKYNYITDNDNAGIYVVKNNKARKEILNNSIIENLYYGIYDEGGLFFPDHINYNNIYGSGSYDFYGPRYDTVDAKYNYWGPAATAEMNAGGNPKDISTIYDFFDDISYGRVDYSQWLDNLILLPPTGIMSTPGDTTIGLSWTASEGAAGYYLYYGQSSGSYNSPIDIGNNTSYQLTGLSNNTTYYIALTTYDNQNNESTHSYELEPTTGPLFQPNSKPNTPNNPTPADGATNQSINTTLTWQGGDSDTGDTVTYDVYFGTSSTPSFLTASNLTTTSYNPGTLSYSTTYYWKVVAKDNHGATSTSPVWSFTTGTKPNNPPNTPSSPSPADGATGIGKTQTLSWSGGDPDTGDTVVYDVYWDGTGNNPDPPLWAANQTDTTVDVSPLQKTSTAYYWKVVARDNHGVIATSPIWKFTTAATFSNNPPNTPSNPSPADGAATIPVTTSLTWNGSDPDSGDTVSYNLYFGTSSSPPLVKSGLSETNYNPGTLAYDTTYYWRVVAKDNHGAEAGGSVWSFTTQPPLIPSTPTDLKVMVKGKTLHIQWQANSESNLDHYNLYAGYASKNYDMQGIPFNLGKVTSLTAPDVPEGTYYLALSAVNSAGQESSLSEEIKVVVGGKPSITISTNKSSYSPGDTLSLSFSLSNPTATTQIADVFLGIIAPDGSIYFFDSSPFLPKLVPARADDPRTFTPASTSLELSPGYDFPLTPFFSISLPTGLPEGTYQALAALAEPGSVQAGSPKIIGNISLAPFSFTR